MMFGNHLKVSGQLRSKLNSQGLTLQELFSIPHIDGDIKQNMELFLSYCRKQKQFTTELLKICFNSPYQVFEDQKYQNVASTMIEALAMDEEVLTDFLFGEVQGQQEPETETMPDILDIEAEAEKLFSDEPEEQAKWKRKADEFQKYELVKLTLAILDGPIINETCLGYINKIYSAILRHEPHKFLQFLNVYQNYISLFLNNIHHYAIGNLVMLILSAQDKTAQYPYEKLKQAIIQNILNICLENIANGDKLSGMMYMMEEILNTTKSSYYEHFDDFKRCANFLIRQDSLRKFYSFLGKNVSDGFFGAVAYLDLVVRRVNADNEDHDYYRQNQSSEPTMAFQHQFLFQELSSLADLIPSVLQSEYSSAKKIAYISFVLSLLRSPDMKNYNVDYVALFKNFMLLLLEQKGHGMIINYVYQLICVSLNQIATQKIEELLHWIFTTDQLQRQIKKLNPNDQLVNINKNQTSCFFSKIMTVLYEKSPGYFEKMPFEEFSTIQKYSCKYQIKLAKQQQPTSPQNSDFFTLQFALESLNKKSEESNVVKNVSIPSLNLPNGVSENGTNGKVFNEEQQIARRKSVKEKIINDLKSTKIELPERYRQKNNEETEEVQQNQTQQKQLSSVKPPELHRYGSDQMFDWSTSWEKSQKKNKITTQEHILFYVKHLILF